MENNAQALAESIKDEPKYRMMRESMAIEIRNVCQFTPGKSSEVADTFFLRGVAQARHTGEIDTSGSMPAIGQYASFGLKSFLSPPRDDVNRKTEQLASDDKEAERRIVSRGLTKQMIEDVQARLRQQGKDDYTQEDVISLLPTNPTTRNLYTREHVSKVGSGWYDKRKRGKVK